MTEADGTLSWDQTTIVICEVEAGGLRGLGYTYADSSTARLINDVLADAVEGIEATDIPAASTAMYQVIRNLGRPGIASMAISAVDVALWDLKGKLFGRPVRDLLGGSRSEIDLYGSGGFTNYSDDQLRAQLGGWAEEGFRAVKMKIGGSCEEEGRRMALIRSEIGDAVKLMIDANGAYRRKQALQIAEVASALGVVWFEEPVSSDDLSGLRLLRDRAPTPVEISAGEYAYDIFYFRRMLEAGAVDILQADATRCGGITGFMKAASLAEAFSVPLSAHCAPALHVHPGCAVSNMVHLEWFHDHSIIEAKFFEGAPRPVSGSLAVLSEAGLGLRLRRADLEPYSVRE
ncbi:enolase C-terminal domain-like protein [Tianweitania sediminis]|nr:enolase C-terminal domain-like protein [Tianweitania sediminis]